LSFQNVNNFVGYFIFFYVHSEGETPEVVDMDQTETKEENSSANTRESLPPQPPRKKKKTED